ncbi:MAG: hypothetical protein U0V70_16395 [Terriglobia bacterium]
MVADFLNLSTSQWNDVPSANLIRRLVTAEVVLEFFLSPKSRPLGTSS